MKLKNILIGIYMKQIIISIALFVMGAILSSLSLVLTIISESSINIVGGADLSTFLYVFNNESGGLYSLLASLGVLFIIAALLVAVWIIIDKLSRKKLT